jgi:glycosyltransferase involved in cell wall biosynthesis
MCRGADVVVCCNEELRALSGRPDARLLPTPYRREPEAPVADTPETDPLRLLWIGMDLTKLRPWEEELAAIAGGDPGVRIVLSSHKQKPPPFAFPFHYERWSREKERELLAGGGLGIMPLEDDANSRGKCALKLIQYMAHGLVPVASDVGFNREVVRDGVDGFLCPTPRRLRDVVRAARAGELDLAGLRRAALERAEQFSARALYPRLKEILWTAWESRR